MNEAGKWYTMKKYKYFTIFICGIVIYAGVDIYFHHQKSINYLKEIEQNTDLSSDSLSFLLHKCPVDRLSQQWEALYNLLECRSIISVGNDLGRADSLLDISLSYYINHTDSFRLSEACYYKGLIYVKYNLPFQAFKYFEKAVSLDKSGNNINKRYNLDKILGEIYHFKMDKEKEWRYKTEALLFADLSGHNLWRQDALAELGIYYSSQKKFEYSISLYKWALLIDNSDKNYQLNLYRLLSEDCIKAGYLDAVPGYIGKITNFQTDSLFISDYLKGLYFMKKQERDSAIFYLESALNSQDPEIHKNILGQLTTLFFLKRNNTKTFHYSDEYVQFNRKLDTLEQKKLLQIVDNKQVEVIELQRAIDQKKTIYRDEIMITWASFAILMVIMLSLLLYEHIQRKKHILEIDLLKSEEERNQIEFEKLQTNLTYYKHLNEITLPVLLKKRNRQGAVCLTENDWLIITKNTDICFDDFSNRLSKEFPQLTIDEIRFCCLLKMEVSLNFLSQIYHIAKESISRRKMRMKEKMVITKTSLDDFLKTF